MSAGAQRQVGAAGGGRLKRDVERGVELERGAHQLGLALGEGVGVGLGLVEAQREAGDVGRGGLADRPGQRGAGGGGLAQAEAGGLASGLRIGAAGRGDRFIHGA